jgi:mannitol/fructose-specific phosphotransferase system IIA component (Ntr-type)
MIVELQANDRWEAIEELIGHLVTIGKISPDHRPNISEAVRKREQAMSTGIGQGIAIPHASAESVSDVIRLAGVSKKGIFFDARDGKPVYLVVLLLTPAGQTQKHINEISTLARSFRAPEFKEALEKVSEPGGLERLGAFIPS